MCVYVGILYAYDVCVCVCVCVCVWTRIYFDKRAEVTHLLTCFTSCWHALLQVYTLTRAEVTRHGARSLHLIGLKYRNTFLFDFHPFFLRLIRLCIFFASACSLMGLKCRNTWLMPVARSSESSAATRLVTCFTSCWHALQQEYLIDACRSLLREFRCDALRFDRYLKAAYTSSLRPHSLVA